MIAGILPCQVAVLRSLLIGFLAICIINTAMGQEKKFLPTQIGIFYNYPPDSLFVNDEPVAVPPSGETWEVEAGIHKIRATLDGCPTIDEQVEVRQHGLRYAIVKFEPNTASASSRIFALPTKNIGGKTSLTSKSFVRTHSILMATATGAGWIATADNFNSDDLLPGIIPAIAAHIVWPLLVSRRFDSAIGRYQAPAYRQNSFSISLDASWGIDNQPTEKSGVETVNSTLTTRTQQAGAGLEFGNLSFALTTRYAARTDLAFYLSGVYFPEVDLRTEFFHELLRGVAATVALREQSFSRTSSHQIFQLHLGAEKEMVRILEQQWFVGIAPILSSKIEQEEEFYLPRLPAVQIGDTVNTTYSVNLSGFKIYLRAIIPFTNNIRLVSKFQGVFGETVTLLDKKTDFSRFGIYSTLSFRY